jgi:hypothetical protein
VEAWMDCASLINDWVLQPCKVSSFTKFVQESSKDVIKLI